MATAWQILREGGVPLAIAGTHARPTTGELAAAVRVAIHDGPTGRDAEALAAWIFAWHHHWPTSFTQAFSSDRDAVLEWASRNAIDDDRYLKLRRIAIERLATLL